MLYTNLKHIESAYKLSQIIHENQQVVVICGNMGPGSIPVYRITEELEDQYAHVKFYDLEYENPELTVIRSLPEMSTFKEIPIVIYYKNGDIVKATSGLQTKAQVKAILDQQFAESENAAHNK
ncbi:MAG TPA: thioredoxin family protein [Prolixibacteraceae bacterium]